MVKAPRLPGGRQGKAVVALIFLPEELVTAALRVIEMTKT